MDASEIVPGLWVASRFYTFDMPDVLLVDVSGEPDAEAAKVAGLYIWWPFEDGPDVPDLESLIAAAFVAREPVVFRCDSGRNRSPLLAGLVLIRRGYTGERALRTLRERRTTAKMSRCLSNQAFVEYLSPAP